MLFNRDHRGIWVRKFSASLLAISYSELKWLGLHLARLALALGILSSEENTFNICALIKVQYVLHLTLLLDDFHQRLLLKYKLEAVDQLFQLIKGVSFVWNQNRGKFFMTCRYRGYVGKEGIEDELGSLVLMKLLLVEVTKQVYNDMQENSHVFTSFIYIIS